MTPPQTPSRWQNFKESQLAKKILYAVVSMIFLGGFGGICYMFDKTSKEEERKINYCRAKAPSELNGWLTRHYPNSAFHFEKRNVYDQNNEFEVFMDGVAPFAVNCRCGIKTRALTLTCVPIH